MFPNKIPLHSGMGCCSNPICFRHAPSLSGVSTVVSMSDPFSVVWIFVSTILVLLLAPGSSDTCAGCASSWSGMPRSSQDGWHFDCRNRAGIRLAGYRAHRWSPSSIIFPCRLPQPPCGWKHATVYQLLAKILVLIRWGGKKNNLIFGLKNLTIYCATIKSHTQWKWISRLLGHSPR